MPASHYEMHAEAMKCSHRQRHPSILKLLSQVQFVRYGVTFTEDSIHLFEGNTFSFGEH